MYSIVKKLGGEIYAAGNKAMIPGPGHSPSDRSISLLLSPNGKIRVHAFSDHDWRDVMDWLKREDLVTDDHRLLDRGPAVSPPAPGLAVSEKRARAAEIWGRGVSIVATPSFRWLTFRRRISRPLGSPAFRHAADAPVSVYNRNCAQVRPAFMAKVRDRDGTHTGTEITYLDPAARKDIRLYVPRKLVGSKPPGAAVQIDEADSEIVVAEGVPSALSASQFFSLPCQALLGVKSFPTWRPPAGVRRVVIAGEPGPAGETFSKRLERALLDEGYACRLEFPPNGYSDFNAYYGGKG